MVDCSNTYCTFVATFEVAAVELHGATLLVKGKMYTCSDHIGQAVRLTQFGRPKPPLIVTVRTLE